MTSQLIAQARKRFEEFGKLTEEQVAAIPHSVIMLSSSAMSLANELEEAERQVERLKAAQPPCDGGCNYNSGPEETCSAHGRPVAEVWNIVEYVARQRNEAERERDEWKRLFSECHPVHLDGVRRAYEAERRIENATAFVEAGELEPRLEPWRKALLLALHPVAEGEPGFLASLNLDDPDDEPYDASQKFGNLRAHGGMNGFPVAETTESEEAK